MESGPYTRVDNWWDKRGENEPDLVAVNEFNHTGTIAEVKRSERKTSLLLWRPKWRPFRRRCLLSIVSSCLPSH